MEVRLGRSISAALIVCSFAACLFGQATDGNLVGTITDASGATVAGADIRITNQATGIQTTTKSNAGGDYRFGNMPVGAYDLSVAAAGFSTATQKSVAIDLNKTTRVNVSLQIGTATQTVEVVEAAAAIDTTTAQLQSSFSAQQAQDLPSTSVGSGILNLSLLSAGVSSSGGLGYGTGPSIGGQRPTNNSFSIDGVDNNRKDVTGPVVYVSNEAVAEFSLLQNQFSPEFGHSSGGQFNTVIKSGTNQLHGSLYDYLLNRNLNAIDQLIQNQGLRDNPRFDSNRLGPSLGGPIPKTKSLNNRFRGIHNNATLPAFYTGQTTDAHLASLSEFHTFSPHLTNEVRLSYNRFNNPVDAGNFKFPGLNAFPNILIENDLNLQLGPDPNGPQSTIINSYQWNDNVTWIKGNHPFKFGYDGRDLIAPQSFVQRSRGDYDYLNLSAFIP